eukprot:scaffold3945_cov105-Isochrysis_galbana.AAC.3
MAEAMVVSSLAVGDLRARDPPGVPPREGVSAPERPGVPTADLDSPLGTRLLGVVRDCFEAELRSIPGVDAALGLLALREGVERSGRERLEAQPPGSRRCGEASIQSNSCTRRSNGADERGSLRVDPGVRPSPPPRSAAARRASSTSCPRTATMAQSVASAAAPICVASSAGASRSAAASVAERSESSLMTGGRSICGAMSPSVLLSLAMHLRTSPESSRCDGSVPFSLSNCSSAQSVGPRGECCSRRSMMKLSVSSRCCATSAPKSARHGSRSRSSSSRTSNRI